MKLSTTGLRVLTALAQRADQKFSGADMTSTLGVASGTLYPLLIRFEKEGLVRSEWELESPSNLGRPRRRYYEITGAGVQLAKAEQRRIYAGGYGFGVTA